jgi:hypothetical protein
MSIKTWSQALLGTAVAMAAGSGHAADAVFTNQGSFLASASGLQMESFETLAGRTLDAAPVVAPLMTLSVSLPGIGVQSAVNAPQTGYGASPSDGTHYVLVYAVATAPGVLTFDLARPSTAFGLTISDIGDGGARFVRLATDAGTYTSGVNVLSFSGGQASGASFFLGLTQDTPFTRVQLFTNGFDEAYGIDGVYVNAVPEPATWALWLGGAGLLAWRRRRVA